MNLPLILAISGGLILTAGDIALKKWVTSSFPTYYVAGIFLYFVSMNLLAQSYKYEDVVVASFVMVIFNVVTMTFAGYFIFKENITSYEITGIILAIIALFFLEFGKK